MDIVKQSFIAEVTKLELRDQKNGCFPVRPEGVLYRDADRQAFRPAIPAR